MTRPVLALACLVIVSAAFAAPVPKSLKAEHIKLTGCRPLLIRTAVVENGELKLTGPEFATRPAELETRSRSLKEVSATDRDGCTIDTGTLTARLKKPVLVVVVPVEENDDYSREHRPKTDDSNDWRRVLAKDVIVIDGKAFKYDWWTGRYDVRLDPMTVDGRKVTTEGLGKPPFGGRRWYDYQHQSTLDPDQLLEVNDQEWAEWLRRVDRHRVEVNFRGEGEMPDAYRELFLDEYLDRKTPHFKRPPEPQLTPQRIHGGIL